MAVAARLHTAFFVALPLTISGQSAASVAMMPWDPANVPGPGWPGASVDESNAAWPTGVQLASLRAWPTETSSGKPMSCWKTSVLRDTKSGWKGQCHDLEKVPAHTDVESCEASCKASATCSVWQFRATSECYQGEGIHCDTPAAGEPAANIVQAQRIQHGEVRVLKDMKGWEVLNLRPLGFWSSETGNQSAESCRAFCYSVVTCQYWQYGAGGCFVEDPTNQMMGLVEKYRAQYPLTTAGGATMESAFAHSAIGAEYIQHLCPAHPTLVSATGSPEEKKKPLRERLKEPKVLVGLSVMIGAVLCCCIGLSCCCCCGSWDGSDTKPARKTRGVPRKPGQENTPMLLKIDEMSETSSFINVGDSFVTSPTASMTPAGMAHKARSLESREVESGPGYLPVASTPPPNVTPSPLSTQSSIGNSFVAVPRMSQGPPASVGSMANPPGQLTALPQQYRQPAAPQPVVQVTTAPAVTTAPRAVYGSRPVAVPQRYA